MRKLLPLVLLMLIGTGASEAGANSVTYPNMPVACLPDRAQQDQMAACHCPPIEMCDEMPDLLKDRCGCKKGESGLCPGAYPNSPTLLSSCPITGEQRDINGRCCSDGVKQLVAFKSWHVRWREKSDYSTIRILARVTNQNEYALPYNFSRDNNLDSNVYSQDDVNWLRRWLPNYKNGDLLNGLTKTNVENGNQVNTAQRYWNGMYYVTAANSYSYNSGDVLAKVCPESDNSVAITPSYNYNNLYVAGSMFCSVKNQDATEAVLPVHMWGGYYMTQPDAYKFSNCCLYNMPSEVSCLAPNTLVLMADGSEKMIQKIVKGDVVKGKTSNNVVQEVVILTLDNRDMYSLNDGVLKLTAEHPIMTIEGWKSVNGDAEKAKLKYNLESVGILKLGDEIITKDGKIKLEKMEKLPLEENTTTFNLKLDGDETFYAGGVLVKDN